jgi:hypothetical protein
LKHRPANLADVADARGGREFVTLDCEPKALLAVAVTRQTCDFIQRLDGRRERVLEGGSQPARGEACNLVREGERIDDG